jgi:hypothetical protein
MLTLRQFVMIKPTYELAGTLALVHPDLPNDPAGRQGQVGMITGTDLEKDDVFVSFGRGEQALYSGDALLVLRPAETIYTTLMTRGIKTGYENFKTLFQINLLQQHGGPDSVKKAMALAVGNSALRDHSMETLEDRLNHQQSRGFER